MAKRAKEKVAKANDESSSEWDHGTIVFATSLLVYASSCYRTIPGGDSSELITSAFELGVPHPPGYPLVTILLSLWLIPVRLLNVAYIPWAAALLNSVIAAYAACRLFRLLVKMTSCVPSAIVATFLFSFSPNAWEWASNFEVFTMNNLLVILVVDNAVDYFAAMKEQPEASRPFLSRGVLLSGLALTNQHTSIIFILPLAIAVMLKESRTKHGIPFRHVIQCLALPLSLYLYLPISAIFFSARWSWGDCSSVSGIITHVLRSEYGTFSLASGHAGKGLLVMSIHNILHLFDNLGIFWFLLGCFGFLLSFWSPFVASGRMACYLYTLYSLFFNWRCNLNPGDKLHAGVIARFYLQPTIIFMVFIAVSLNWIKRKLSAKYPNLSEFKMVITAYSVAVVIVAARFNSQNYSKYSHVADFGVQLVNSFPEEAIVMMKGDLPSNTFTYLELVEKRRPDVAFLNTQPMTYTWWLKYQQHRFPDITFPGTKYHLTKSEGTFSMADLIKANPTRNFIGCIMVQELEKFPEAEFLIRPWGPCDQFFLRSNYTEEETIEERDNYVAEKIGMWPHGISFTEGLPQHSWESVSNNEMWQGKIRHAMLAYDTVREMEAKGISNTAVVVPLLEQSYRMYKRAIEAEEARGVIPTPHWYKNFGLIHPKLVSLQTQNAVGNYSETIECFKKYLSLSDRIGEKVEDRAAVEAALKQMSSFVGAGAK